MDARSSLDAVILRHGFDKFCWIDPREIVVAHWVRMKCVYGCSAYGKYACCPPNVPSVEECRAFFQEYSRGVLLHFPRRFENPEERHTWHKEVNQKLSALEQDVFISGYHKAFMLFMDSSCLCGECGRERGQCVNPKRARPAPEGFAVDVFSTVRKYGLPIRVLPDQSAEINRYAILLVE